MAQDKFYVHNGQSWPLEQMPLLEDAAFRQEILEECSLGARLINLFAYLEDDQNMRICAMLGMDNEGRVAVISMRLPSGKRQFDSLTPALPQAHMFEREIAEQFAIEPLGHPDLKPVRYHKNYRHVPDLWPQIAVKPIPGDYSFYRVGGEEIHPSSPETSGSARGGRRKNDSPATPDFAVKFTKTDEPGEAKGESTLAQTGHTKVPRALPVGLHEVAVGPVHAGIIEPGHFRFQCHGEEVLNLEIQLGYQHRGIEKMMAGAPLERAVLLAESIAGDTVIGHATAFCSCMEALSDGEVSAQAEMVRAMALELERLANHVGDLGALGTDIGFLPTAAYFGRLRGEFLNLLMEVSGSRYGRSLCRPGGVLFSFDQEMIKDFYKRLLRAQKDLKEIAELFFSRPSVLSRLEGTGSVPLKAAKEIGLVGPAARASGHGVDVRTDYAYGMYRFHHIPISLVSFGDVYARALIRWLEAQRSIEFLLEALAQIPKGDLLTQRGPLKPNHMALSMVEGWRGEIVHVLTTDSDARIARYKIKDPSFHNWTGLALALRGAQISDFPLCNKSFNLSYAGHDL